MGWDVCLLVGCKGGIEGESKRAREGGCQRVSEQTREQASERERARESESVCVCIYESARERKSTRASACMCRFSRQCRFNGHLYTKNL